MGEFFELFWDDAGRASRWLGITQTTRGAHGGRAIPMAGVPLHAAPTHWSRLVRAGRRVAVAEQRGSQPSGATGVVERAVTRILTPGTATDLHTDVGGDGEAPPSFFAVVVPGPAEGDGIGVGWADVSTGQMVVARAAGGWDDVHGLLARHPPSEVVLPAAPDGSASAGALRLASALSRGALAGCDDAVPTWLAEAWLRPSTDEGELWDRLRLRQGAGAHEGTAALSPAELAAAVATVEYAAWTGACGLRGDATDDGVGWAEVTSAPAPVPLGTPLRWPARLDEGGGGAAAMARPGPSSGAAGPAGGAAAAWRADPAAWRPAPTMLMDGPTLRALELHRALTPGARRRGVGSLVRLVDRTRTPAGSHLLDARLGAPLASAPAVRRRLDAVSQLLGSAAALAGVRESLRGAGDPERGARRLALGRSRSSVRDAACVRDALRAASGAASALRPVHRAAAGAAAWAGADAWQPVAAAARCGFDWSGGGGTDDGAPSVLSAVASALGVTAGDPEATAAEGGPPRHAHDDAPRATQGRPDTVAAATAAVRDLRSHLEAALVESVPENAGATAGVGALGRSPRVAANRARTAAAAVADVDSGEDDGGSAPSSGAAEAAGRGSWVRRGYCEELERAYALRDGAEDAAAEAERALKSKLGVAGLRVKRVGEGGFFVDVPRRSEEAPLLVAALESGALWRVRTLKSSLRCKSADLVELDKAAAEAAHAVGALEGAVFDRLAERVRGAAWALDAVWAALAVLDVSASHAVAAQELRLRRPVVVGPWEARRRLGVPCGAATSGGQGEGRVEDLGSSLYASGLRHLVVERGLQEGWGLPTSGAATAAGDGEDASAGPEAWKDGGAGSGDASPAPGEAGGTSAKAFVPLVVSMRGRVGTGGAAAPRDGVEAEAVAAADAASPRETALHLEGRQLVVTGPNVAGKSTLLRATAQAAVLAQAGSFVPAESMLLGACDRVFARVGASDDLARERSTFLVEMEEAASFLRHSGPSSLVVVDELGRGTATSDGLAIAAATLHELASPAVDARTLFATHFHQLSELAGECPAEAAPAPAAGGTASEGGASPRWLSAAMAEAGMPLDQLGAGGCACAGSGVRCRSMEVWEGADRDDAVFTFRLVRGGASRSLGIAAAARAGVPGHVVEAAQRLMGRLDERA